MEAREREREFLPSFTEFFFWFFWVCCEFERNVPSFTEFCLVLRGLTEILPSFTGFPPSLIGLYRFYSFLPSFTWFSLTWPSFTEFYRVLPSFTKFYRVFTEFSLVFIDSISFYRGVDRVPFDFTEFLPSFIGLATTDSFFFIFIHFFLFVSFFGCNFQHRTLLSK